MPRGVTYYCKICSVKSAFNWNNKNPEKYKENKNKSAKNNPNSMQKWHEKNPDFRKTYMKMWREKNPAEAKEISKRSRDKNIEKVLDRNQKRRSAERRCAPAWANSFFIQEAYTLARLRTKTTNFKWHVDHIVPIKGATVCGLHVEANLQVIPAITNLKKGHRAWPDMP